MVNINLELEDSLYEDIKKQGIDLQAQFQEFLADFKDSGYPAISTEEAKKIINEEVEDYRKNGMKNCGIVNDEFWDDIEKSITESHKKAS